MTDADSERLFIGVDGGQSSTLTVLANQRGEILASALTGPCNHIHEPGGLERQYRTLREGYERVFAAAGLPVTPVECVYLGLTGSGHLETVSRVYATRGLVLKSDVGSALAGALPETPGVIIIAGTGSTAHGRNARGEEVTVGGHGYIAGDEGSAYDIARRAFQAVFQASDGRSPQTALTALLFEQYGATTLRELRRAIYGAEMTRDRLARAAGTVGRAAAEGDPVSIRILADAGLELGRMVGMTLLRLGMTAEPAPVAPIGGVFRAGELVTGPMLARIHQDSPRARLVTPRFVPAVGAAILALREGGVTISAAVLDNFERTRDRLTVGSSGDKSA
jgi:N-acetylglucosamine kinase-like BadF-type ATPase